MNSLKTLFSSPVVADVLSFMLGHSEEAFYQRLIAEKTGHTLFQVQNALNRIELTGLVKKTREGKRLYYQVISSHPAFSGLQQAFLASEATTSSN